MSLYDRIFLFESDSRLRRLERETATGDSEAKAKEIITKLRAGQILRPSKGRETLGKPISYQAARRAEVASREAHDTCAFCDRALRSNVHWGEGDWGARLPYCSPSCRRASETD